MVFWRSIFWGHSEVSLKAIVINRESIVSQSKEKESSEQIQEELGRSDRLRQGGKGINPFQDADFWWGTWSLPWKRPQPNWEIRLTLQTNISKVLREGIQRGGEAGVAKTGADVFTHSFPEGGILKSVSYLNLPTSSPLGLSPWLPDSPWWPVPLERGPGLHSELTVMSGAHPTWPSNGQFCLGPTGDAYLVAFSAPGSLGEGSSRCNYWAAP